MAKIRQPLAQELELQNFRWTGLVCASIYRRDDLPSIYSKVVDGIEAILQCVTSLYAWSVISDHLFIKRNMNVTRGYFWMTGYR